MPPASNESSESQQSQQLTASNRQNEMALLESQLTASIRLQIENIRAGIAQMEAMSAQTLPRALPSQLADIVELCNQTDAMISNYSFIKLVSRTHANFQQTRAIYDQFRVLDEQIERINGLLDRDREAESLDNVLLIYCRLAQLGAFRDKTMEMVKNAPSSLVYTLKRYFKKLDDLSTAFDSFYWVWPSRLIELAQDGNRGADIVKIAQVLNRMPESNRSRFFEILESQVSNRYTVIDDSKLAEMDGALESVSFYLEDLKLVRDQLAPRFPPQLGLLDFFLLTHHRNIHSVLNKILLKAKRASSSAANAQNTTKGPDLTAGQILALLGWVKGYHDSLESQFGIASEELEPRLLDNREPRLIADYVKLSKAKISEWIGNLLTSETRNFATRTVLPDADGDNRYFTPATVDLFQIVKQHVDMAASVSSTRLLSEIVNECVVSVGTFQRGLIRMLEHESAKYFERPDNVAPYFEDYVIMMGNSALRWIENMQALSASLEDLLRPEFLGPAQKQLKGASDGFLAVAKCSTQILVDVIVGAIKSVLGQLFALEWYSDPVVETIIATYEDFFTDYQAHAEEFLMVKLIADVLDRTVLLYIEAMRWRNARLKMSQSAPELLDRDISSLTRFFSRFRDPKRVEKAIDPIVKLRTLLCASRKMVFLEFFALLKAYPDAPLALMEELLAKRDDFDRPAVKEVMDSVRAKLQEEKVVDSPVQSVFSKIKIVPK